MHHMYASTPSMAKHPKDDSTVTCPPSSLDLNPVANLSALWSVTSDTLHLFKGYLGSCGCCCGTKWWSADQDSMDERLMAVTEKKGGYTGYKYFSDVKFFLILSILFCRGSKQIRWKIVGFSFSCLIIVRTCVVPLDCSNLKTEGPLINYFD